VFQSLVPPVVARMVRQDCCHQKEQQAKEFAGTVVAPNRLVVPVLADPIPDSGCFRPKRLRIGLLVLPILTQPVVLSLVMMTVSRNPVPVVHPRQVNCSSLRSLVVIPWLLPRDLRVAGVGFVANQV
jgi:hypothetical protein